ncbi:MAG TPA: phenylacetate--CoA ligase, partial [Clostridia bacterium]
MEGYIWNKEIECMSAEALRGLQGERLVDCVRRMATNVPYYAAKMKKAGLEPGDIRGMDDLPGLPFTDKYDFADNYPYGTFAVPMDQIVRLHAS